jgi:hypothetical protein
LKVEKSAKGKAIMNNHQSAVRLVYASKATFKPFTEQNGIDVNVTNILHTARQNNEKHHLVGALYYGNGCFVQCLEGSKAQIDDLYKKLQHDPRHEQLQVLQLQDIDDIGFSDWKMKYATIDVQVRHFLRRHQMVKFDPYRLDAAMVSELVDLMHDAPEALPH